MTLSPQAEHVALQVLGKYCRKGNLTRSLRDFLPSADLSRTERDNVANVLHQIVRWKKLYTYLLQQEGKEATPEALLSSALSAAEQRRTNLPAEYQHSCSQYVARLFTLHPDWAEFLNSIPPTTLCVNQNLGTKAEVIDHLRMDRLPFHEGTLGTAVISPSSEIKQSSVIRERLAFVQDESSQLVAWMTAGVGQQICDCCAGNGGKTLALASILQNTAQIDAVEVNESRRLMLQQRLVAFHAQATVRSSMDSSRYDVVLVDAPCSGLGAARRNPEAKYIEGVDDFPTIQGEILQRASQSVREHGFLVYAVCTITPEETSSVIASFTSSAPFDMMPAPSAFSSLLRAVPEGFITMVPEGDLFFVSILQKRPA